MNEEREREREREKRRRPNNRNKEKNSSEKEEDGEKTTVLHFLHSVKDPRRRYIPENASHKQK